MCGKGMDGTERVMTNIKKQNFIGAIFGSALLFAAPAASALPALQLGPGTGAGWSWDSGSETWVNSSNPGSFEVTAYANAVNGNGQYAWQQAGASTQLAYLVVSAVPQASSGMVDLFEIDVTAQGQGALTLMFQGFGSPPASDPNSLAPHSVFDNYYELYRFTFDGPVTTIFDQQPGSPPGSGLGHEEHIAVSVNSLEQGVTGIHFDLFTMEGDGTLANNTDLYKFAPFSHDAEWEPVGEPVALGLVGLGLVGLGLAARRRKTA